MRPEPGDLTMATKTAAPTYTGTLTRVNVLDDAEVDYNYSHRYAPNTEHRIKRLDCALKLTDGSTVYFKSPASPYRISSCPVAAIVSFTESEYNKDLNKYVFPADHPWFRVEGSRAVETREEAADVTLVPKVKVGDQITVKGRIKTQTVSRAGNPYTVLTHAKKV